MQEITIDTRHSDNVPRILLYSSCLADQIHLYLRSKQHIFQKYAIDTLLIHLLELRNVKDLLEYEHKHVIQNADIICTNCFSPRWDNLGLHRVMELKKDSCSVMTWVPPNFAAFWPISESHGEHGVLRMKDNGASAMDVVNAFNDMSFDPMFSVRWIEQIERLKDREMSCDIPISGFCENNYRKTKLWFTENHPSYNIVAWIGSRICKAIGEQYDTEDECVSYDSAFNGSWNSWPETDYEFSHFGFSYTKKYAHTQHWGGLEFYRKMILKIFDRTK